MQYQEAFLDAIRTNPADAVSRLVYADWLEEQGDGRSDFLRLHLALRSLSPDHPHRVGGEQELSRLRKDIDRNWLAVVEPERAHLYEVPPRWRSCECVKSGIGGKKWSTMKLHIEPQDTECDAWKRLLDLVEQAAADGREEFAPRREMEPEDWIQIVTLPPTITKLKAVRRLLLYGSHLVRIPPEIGEMTNLERFDPYTSYRLHWFPYEITRCRNLRESTVSTRAIYGNYKYRPPFPQLQPKPAREKDVPDPVTLCKVLKEGPTRNCSVCGSLFEDRQMHRVWTSLCVATDVLPLLVNACSQECVERLPQPPDDYIPGPHRGGPAVQQPPPRW